MKEQIINELKKAKDFFLALAGYSNEIDASEAKIQSMQNDFDYQKNKVAGPFEKLHFIVISVLILCSIVYAVSYLAAFLEGVFLEPTIIIGMYIPGGIVLAVIGAILAIINVVNKKIENKYDLHYKSQVKPKIEEEKTHIQETFEELKEFVEKNKTTLDFLPVKYRTLQATDYMLDVLQSGEADNMKEAFALYNTYEYRLGLAEQAEEERLRLFGAIQELNRQQEETNRNLKSIQNFEYWKYLNDKK